MVGVLLVAGRSSALRFSGRLHLGAVLAGFKAGIGVVIVLDQVPKLLGVHFPKGSFLQNLLALFKSLPDTSAATLAVGLAMMALLLGLKRFVPRVPAPLVTVGAGIAAMALLGLQAYGVETVGGDSARRSARPHTALTLRSPHSCGPAPWALRS